MPDHPVPEYMRLCLDEAVRAFHLGEYPIGALVVLDDHVLSLAHTSLNSENDPTAHAEILAIRNAAALQTNRYIEGGYLYTTCEPCLMCTAAAVFAKLAGIVYCINQADAHELALRYPRSGLSWRQIGIQAEEVISRGNPKPDLFSCYLREEGLRRLEQLFESLDSTAKCNIG